MAGVRSAACRGRQAACPVPKACHLPKRRNAALRTLLLESTMALPHARPATPIDIRPYAATLERQASHALIRSETLELIRLVLAGGDRVPAHTSDREQTLQCLEGLVSVEFDGRLTALEEGEVMLLPAGTPHALKALMPSSLLLTVCLRDVQDARAA